MTAKLFFACLSVSSLVLVTSTKLHSAVVRNVSIAAVSSEYVSGADTRRATNVVAGTDLIGEGHMNAAPRAMWLTSPTAAGSVTNAFITFDLGSVRTLSAMKIWNYNEVQSGANILTRRGIQTADISFAGENQVFTTNLPNQTLLRAPGQFANFAQTLVLSNISARYVRINVLSNFGEGDHRVGLSEVQFIDTSVPPLLLAATRNFAQNQVTLTFSDSLDPSTATNVANYSIAGGISITAATLDSFSNIVYLQTSPLNSNQVYTVTAQNVRDAASGVSITNTTLTIEPELALWLKADAGVTSDGSSLVSAWSDQSGNNLQASQANNVYKPTLVPNALNGKPVLRFNGSSTSTNYLDIPHDPSLVVRRDITIYTVVRAEDFSIINGIISKSSGNQAGPFDMYLVNSTGIPRLYRGNGFNSAGLFGSRSLTAGTDVTNYYVLAASISGTNGTVYLNGTVAGSSSVTYGVQDVGRTLRVGARDDFATRMRGDIAEIIVIRGAVSSAERQSLDNYLGSKYGIPIVSLNITQNPTNQTVLEGESASFRVTAVANSPQISYQWQRNGVDIPGATNATYTIPFVTSADHNTTYRVSVSIPGTSQLSDSATLSVIPDLIAPTVVSAGGKFWAPAEIVVVFSERIDPATATVPGNYTINNGVSVVSAAMRADGSSVTLTTSPTLSSGQGYSVTVQNVRDRFNNTVAVTTVNLGVHPLVPALFLKADSGVTSTIYGTVTQWNDASGNGNHVVQNFGGDYEPTLLANAFNGAPAISFDGATDYLYCLPSPSLAVTGDISIFAVARFADFANFNAIISKTTGNLPAPFDYYLAAGHGAPVLYRGNGAGAAAQVTAAAAPSIGVPHLIAVTMRGTTVTHYLDTAVNGTGTLNTTIGDNGDALGVGTRSDLGTKMKGEFAEIALLPGVMADVDRVEFENYLNAKYAFYIPPTPPSIAVARAGNNVVLSWPTAPSFILETATSVSGSVWTPVSGTTSANGTNSYSVSASSARQFYRLRKP